MNLEQVKGSLPTTNRTLIKRLVLIGWGIYAVTILLLPLWDEAKERGRAFERNSAAYQVCKSGAEKRGISVNQLGCDQVYQARMDRDAATYQFGSDYRAVGWHLAWIVPVSLLVPPLILFVFLYGLVKTVTWLNEFCRSPLGASPLKREMSI